MIERKANVYRLEPTPEQAGAMSQFAGACRLVYNLALEQRRDWWRSYRNTTGKAISYAGQCRELTEMRREVDWLRAVPVHALQQALKDVERAYQNFFAGRAAYPRPHKKGVHDAFRLPDPSYLAIERTGRRSGRVKVPKIGWVRLRGWYNMPGALRNVTITRRGGHWYAAVQWEREIPDPASSTLAPVGIDRGVAVPIVCSSGYMVPALNPSKRMAAKVARVQRSLARKIKFSSNWKKEKARLTRLKAKEAAMRRDLLHQVSTVIAKSHGTVFMEDLKTRNMSASAKGTVEKPGRNVRAKSGLNKAIRDQGWYAFQRLLGYKLHDRGGRLILVDPAYTSQTCSKCDTVDAESRRSQAAFQCTACGHEDNADINAAKNILRRGSPLMPVGEGGCASNEAGTNLEEAA